MATNIGAKQRVYEVSRSGLLPQSMQMEQNTRDLSSALGYIVENQHHNLEAESDEFGKDHALLSGKAEAEVLTNANVDDASATQQQNASSLLEGTVHEPPDETVIAQDSRRPSEDPPATETGKN